MSEVPIEKRDWRLQMVTLLEGHRKIDGKYVPIEPSPAELVGFIERREHGLLAIPFPNPVAIYLGKSRSEFKAAECFLAQELPKVIDDSYKPFRGIRTECESQFFDCIQSLMTGVICSFSAIEAFANESLPDSYQFTVHRRKCLETYSKEQIERHISLSVKLDEILPKIRNCTSPKGTVTWERYAKIIQLRDRLIHLKSADWKECQKDNSSKNVITALVKEDTTKMANWAFDLVCHYLPAKKPRWVTQFLLD